MPTLLHISDLHRTSDQHLNNDDLLAAIFSDANRWSLDGISWPEVVVVSGDIIQGAQIGSSDPDHEVESQYSEASDFLKKLSDHLVESDRSRVVIVPGNHDVHWSRSRQAMKVLDGTPRGIAQKSIEANSDLRWDWKQQKAYQIVDAAKYRSRHDHFKQFQSEFYEGLNPNPVTQEDDDLVYFEYPKLGLAVIGFASWYGNDCFCHVGEINPASVAASQKLLAASRAHVAVAVWHHSVLGGPRSQDYMDSRVIHRLIDFGFSVGLHGHQHYPGAAPFELRLPNLTSMVVVSGGSLAVGDSELPMGERRQYNLVDIDLESHTITVHVRAMSAGGVFTGSHRDDFGGNTYVQLSLPHSPLRPRPPTTAQKLDEAMVAANSGHYEEALGLIAGLESCHPHETRLIKVRALSGLGRRKELIEFLDPPQNTDEVVKVISLLLEEKQFNEAVSRLKASSSLVDRTLYRELAGTISARRMG